MTSPGQVPLVAEAMADGCPPAASAPAVATVQRPDWPAAAGLVTADVLTLAVEGLLYLAAAAPAALVIAHHHPPSPLCWLAAAAAGYLATAVAFLALLALGYRVGIRTVPMGRFRVTSPRVWRWIVADRLMKIAYRSPFRAWFTECAPLRQAFLTAMGARCHPCLLLGHGVKLPEPWAVRIGRGVLIGDDAVIAGHKVERGIVTLAPVEIGDGAVIGARAIVLAGARIGAGAVIGAQSVVPQGAVVAPGETWVGNPARPLAFGSRLTPSA